MPLGAALSLLPFMSTGIALVAGAGVALTVGNPSREHTQRAVPLLLSLAVVGLGAGMDLRGVARVGAQGILITLVSISACLLLGTLFAWALGVPRSVGLLISIGTAICGGSAIAAVVPVLRPKDQEVSVALGTVFLLNAVALFVFPAMGHSLGLNAGQFGRWCALAIHDTSSVVGAALQYGPEAMEVATTVKLARALWIAPLALALEAWQRRTRGAETPGTARKPWFILGFVLASALVTWVPTLQPAGHTVAAVSKQLLVLTLFLLGANLSRSTLKSVGMRPLAMGVILWGCMAGLSLGALPE
ncbi:putative sulfate exporter family transporter [Stigmatella sp. ncwal1]|uniref:Sulfate exporter family transporter n=1 Tax=Stigmatella ashevillensis TaxID=2995309 RepID=A0ABT5D6L0_9BACT|nr:putative sulfate exporter family transporter [Stigmatella ashevillena]MDC0707882.1 putative sulfate exporter family transporter [Stigmatella ashevillena]